MLRQISPSRHPAASPSFSTLRFEIGQRPAWCDNMGDLTASLLAVRISESNATRLLNHRCTLTASSLAVKVEQSRTKRTTWKTTTYPRLLRERARPEPEQLGKQSPRKKEDCISTSPWQGATQKAKRGATWLTPNDHCFLTASSLAARTCQDFNMTKAAKSATWLTVYYHRLLATSSLAAKTLNAGRATIGKRTNVAKGQRWNTTTQRKTMPWMTTAS